MVDHDTVEAGNLGRQVIHKLKNVGMNKAISASCFVEEINDLITCRAISVLLDRSNALHILKEYDVVVDATDNVATRYLLNDACVLLNKPLVSGAALGMAGQVTVYNDRQGPCLRCIFPIPPPAHTVGTCSDSGILGPVTGTIGALQALQVLELVTGKAASLQGKLLVFDGVRAGFRAVDLRGKKKDCAVCGEEPSITELVDYVQFCGAEPHDKNMGIRLLATHERISVVEYRDILNSKVPHVLLDVREEIQFDICSLDDTISRSYCCS